MRSTAILLVLVSHIRPFLPWKVGGIFGYYGVDLFFVLSGFLIGGILIKTFERDATRKGLVTFWIRRWFRTLPNYFLFFLLNIFLFYVHLLPPDRDSFTVADVPKYIFFLQNFAWIKPMFYGESWSLAIEEWFYIIFPVIALGLTFAIKKAGRIRSAFLTASFFIILFAILFRYYFARHNPQHSFDFIRQIVLAKLDSMMFGVIIALLKNYYNQWYLAIRKYGVPVAVLLIIFVSYVYVHSIRLNAPVVTAILPLIASVGFALLLPYFAEMTVSSSLETVQKWVVNIALWSYSIYLVNLPVRHILLSIQERYHVFSLTGKYCLGVLFITLSIFLSKLIYQYFERPFLAVRDKYYSGKR